MNLIAKTVRRMASAVTAARGARLSILIFHRVLPQVDPLLPDEPDAKAFEERMRWVASGFRVMPLIEAVRRLKDGTLPSNAACITFDDGYADNLTVATPILSKLRLHATFFIASGFLDGGRMFNDTVIESVRRVETGPLDLEGLGLGTWSCASDAHRVATIAGLLERLKYLPQAERDAKVAAIADAVGLPRESDLMMTRDQVRELRRYQMSIGGHTVTHPILAGLPIADARREIDEGRRDLEDTLGEKLRLFAYPNGKPQRDYDSTHVKLVRELGFEAAVSTAWGVSSRTTDRFQLPRFTPWDSNVSKFGLRLARNTWRDAQLA